MNDSIRIVIFAKYPKAGQVKTRLIPAIGAEGATQLASIMLQHTLEQAMQSQLSKVELCVSPDPEHADWQSNWQKTNDQQIAKLVKQIHLTAQGQGDLGERLARAAQRVIGQSKAVIFIGTDCPTLNATLLQQAAIQLQHYDSVMIPASDGGYVLLGLNQFNPLIFSDIKWSTNSVAADTLNKIKTLGWSVSLLPTQHDIDEPEDLNKLPADWLNLLANREKF